MNKLDRTLIDNLQDFLEEAYNNLNHDPNRVFEKDARGNDMFMWEDDLFLMEITFIGIEHIVELHVVYFKRKNTSPEPVWSLSLQGTVFLKEYLSKIRDFRKSMNHMHKYNGEVLPIKGPKASSIGMYKYTHIFVQDWKEFKNRSETILINEKKAFESYYYGGLMMSVESLESIWNEYVVNCKKTHILPDEPYEGYVFKPITFSWPG